jgi:hypothetical protein
MKKYIIFITIVTLLAIGVSAIPKYIASDGINTIEFSNNCVYEYEKYVCADNEGVTIYRVNWMGYYEIVYYYDWSNPFWE